jgi:hypothetical protein
MSSICKSCKQTILNNSIKKRCGSCNEIFCSNCLYQRISVPKLNYQMQEVCTPCFHSISTEMMLQKPPKNFIKRLEQQQPPSQQQKRIQINELDPETKALEERLQQLRQNFPATSASTSKAIGNTPDDLIRQMNDELSIQQNDDKALENRLRILHETMPAATPNTVILPSSIKIQKDEEENNEDEEFPWCTVCNDNATKRCLDCDELFCESCVKKIHRQSGYKSHQLESYRPSAKAKKKYNY